MNTRMKLVVAGVAVIGLAAIGFLLMKSGHDDASKMRQTSPQVGQVSQTTPKTTQASIKDFLAAGENKKCTFSKNNENGTMYFAGRRLRSDIQRSRDGVISKVSMIVKDTLQYVWFDNNQGIKLEYSADNTDTAAVSQGGLDATQTYDFACTNWTVDESKFTPPSTINFTDLSKLATPTAR